MDGVATLDEMIERRAAMVRRHAAELAQLEAIIRADYPEASRYATETLGCAVWLCLVQAKHPLTAREIGMEVRFGGYRTTSTHADSFTSRVSGELRRLWQRGQIEEALPGVHPAQWRRGEGERS